MKKLELQFIRNVGLVLALVLMYASLGLSQQLPTWSSFYDNGFVWNPALTAKWNYWEVSATQRQEWTGFENAPQLTTLGFQFPFIKNNTKASMGFLASQDKVGPYNSTGFSGTYTYKMKLKWFGNYDDVLTIGMLGSLHQYRFNPTRLTAFDPLSNDPIVSSQSDQSILPNFAVGAFYNSVSDFYSFKSHYYGGLSITNLFPGKQIQLEAGQVANTIHLNLHGGYRYFPFRKPYYYEPSIFINYALTRAINVMSQLKFEKTDAFWLAAGLVSNGETFLQAGVIFTEDSILEKILNGGILRLGIKADYALGKIRRYSGFGYEIYLAYLFELE